MNRFLTPLRVEEIDDQSWRLLSPLTYNSDVLGRVVTVPAGFLTDFASVPRIPVAYLLAGDEAHMPAVVHDFLYSSTVCTREQADNTFLEAMASTGVPKWRRLLMWSAVRLFGQAPYDLDQAKGKP